MWPIKTILITTDFSELSNDAHEAACALARQHNARLIVLHVAEQPVVSYFEKASELSADELQNKLWDTLRWPREQENGLKVEHRIKEGDPVKEIVRFATEQHVDLIVMGASGRTGMLRWFTGSVTDDVARDAPCSVLLVKPARAAEPAAIEQAAEERTERRPNEGAPMVPPDRPPMPTSGPAIAPETIPTRDTPPARHPMPTKDLPTRDLPTKEKVPALEPAGAASSKHMEGAPISAGPVSAGRPGG
jgi:nucleotide-binding universal stress UspA family protein